MTPRRTLPVVLALACLMLAGCKDQREPAKPVVDLSDGVRVALLA